MRKLRMYKGIYYYPDTGRWHYCGISYKSAANVITNLPFLSDDDHAPLMDLKKTPYEPVLTLGQVVHAWWERSDKGPFIRAADIEDLCSRLRNAFPNIDGEDA
jgi:hypothetical protein